MIIFTQHTAVQQHREHTAAQHRAHTAAPQYHREHTAHSTEHTQQHHSTTQRTQHTAPSKPFLIDFKLQTSRALAILGIIPNQFNI